MFQSKKGFILGLLGLVLSIIVSIIAFYVLILIFAILKSNGTNTTLGTIFLYLNSFSNIGILIALCFYKKKAKTGGIIMLFSFVFNIAIFIIAPIILQTISDIILVLIISILPSILILISAILGLRSNSKKQF